MDELSGDGISVDELFVDDISEDDLTADGLSVDDLSVDGLSVDDISVDDLSVRFGARFRSASASQTQGCRGDGEPKTRSTRMYRKNRYDIQHHKHATAVKSLLFRPTPSLATTDYIPQTWVPTRWQQRQHHPPLAPSPPTTAPRPTP